MKINKTNLIPPVSPVTRVNKDKGKKTNEERVKEAKDFSKMLEEKKNK